MGIIILLVGTFEDFCFNILLWAHIGMERICNRTGAGREAVRRAFSKQEGISTHVGRSLECTVSHHLESKDECLVMGGNSCSDSRLLWEKVDVSEGLASDAKGGG